MILPKEFYLREDTPQIARDLLGKVLVTRIRGVKTSGMIVETEAYTVTDRACHAFGYRRTKRNEIMYQEGGHAYIYICYGIHHLFNAVTNIENEPHAVLIRAVEPLEGLPAMQKRRKAKTLSTGLTAGPGSLATALGIKTDFNGCSLAGSRIAIEDRGLHIRPKEILSSQRVGINFAGPDAHLPWRFRIRGNKWTSRAK